MKLLGMIIDQRLTGTPQLEALKSLLASRLRALACLASKKWGCDQKTLRDLYAGYIRPVTEYVSPIISIMRRTNVDKLVVFENVCARIITGCAQFRTRTPDVLYLAGLPSIRGRIEMRNAAIFETIKRVSIEGPAYRTTNVNPPTLARRGKAIEGLATWRDAAAAAVAAAGLTNNRLPMFHPEELHPAAKARIRSRVCFYLNPAAEPPQPPADAIVFYTDGSFLPDSGVGGGQRYYLQTRGILP